MNFPEELKTMRHQTGCSLRKAGEEADINFKSIHSWEKGTVYPNMSTFIRYVKWLQSKGVNVNKFEALAMLRGSSNPRRPTAS